VLLPLLQRSPNLIVLLLRLFISVRGWLNVNASLLLRDAIDFLGRCDRWARDWFHHRGKGPVNESQRLVRRAV